MTRPRHVRTVTVLTALNAFRLIGFAFAAQALTGDLPRSEVFGGVGDGIAGLTALPVAYALARRPSYATWVAAIIWNVYACTDAFFANAISTWAPDAEPQSIAAYLIPAAFLIMHAVSLALLVGPLRDWYFARGGSAPRNEVLVS